MSYSTFASKNMTDEQFKVIGLLLGTVILILAFLIVCTLYPDASISQLAREVFGERFFKP